MRAKYPERWVYKLEFQNAEGHKVGGLIGYVLADEDVQEAIITRTNMYLKLNTFSGAVKAVTEELHPPLNMAPYEYYVVRSYCEAAIHLNLVKVKHGVQLPGEYMFGRPVESMSKVKLQHAAILETYLECTEWK